MPDFATTLNYPARARWVERGHCLTVDQPGAARLVTRILRSGRAGLPLVLDGTRKADLVAAAILARRPSGPPVLVTDSTWSRGGSLPDRTFTKLAVALLRSKRMHFSVGTEAEQRAFPRTWKVDPRRVHVTRWYHGIPDDRLEEDAGHEGPVFSGGRSMRDYRPLLLVAERHEWPLTLSAPEWALPDLPVPPSVQTGELAPAAYYEAMREARVVVVPLQRTEDRAAGQSSYLTAMAMGKLVVVTDTLGVTEHVRDGVTGLVVPPEDPDALDEALSWALDPANADRVDVIRSAARREARDRFGPDAHVEQLIAGIEAAVAESGAARR